MLIVTFGSVPVVCMQQIQCSFKPIGQAKRRKFLQIFTITRHTGPVQIAIVIFHIFHTLPMLDYATDVTSVGLKLDFRILLLSFAQVSRVPSLAEGSLRIKIGFEQSSKDTRVIFILITMRVKSRKSFSALISLREVFRRDKAPVPSCKSGDFEHRQ